jgi:hypothetical protein
MGAHSTLTPAPASFEALKRKYADALREFDERPPEFVPRRRITAAGVALLYSPDLDDIAERAAREAREAERQAARELRERQRQHPLYNTHHRDQLIQHWEQRGEPTMPPKALDGFTQWIMRHANALEDDVRQYAKTLERSHKATIIERLGKYADGFYRDKNPTELTQRNIRRALRSAFRQFNEQAAHILGIVGHNGQKYISRDNLLTRKEQLRKQKSWINASTVEGPHLKQPLPLAACIRTIEARIAEMYALNKGLEKYMFSAKGRTALFVTLTAPAYFHPNPTNGQNSWDGSSVTDSHEWFTKTWARFRTDLKNKGINIDGMRVTEPHKDGSEHWHVLMYVKPDDLPTVKAAIQRRFKHSERAVTFSEEAPDDKESKKASPASYMMKYITKGITPEDEEEEDNDTPPITRKPMTPEEIKKKNTKASAAAADAWRATWGVRAFQFFGILYGKQTLWRELRRLQEQPDEPTARRLWRAARGTRAHDFIAALDTDAPEIATIRETVATWTAPDPDTGEARPDGYKAGRIIGVQINDTQYRTRAAKACNIVTDFASMQDPHNYNGINKYTVIPSDPRGMEGFPDFDHGPPGAPPATVAA